MFLRVVDCFLLLGERCGFFVERNCVEFFSKGKVQGYYEYDGRGEQVFIQKFFVMQGSDVQKD